MMTRNVGKGLLMLGAVTVVLLPFAISRAQYAPYESGDYNQNQINISQSKHVICNSQGCFSQSTLQGNSPPPMLPMPFPQDQFQYAAQNDPRYLHCDGLRYPCPPNPGPFPFSSSRSSRRSSFPGDRDFKRLCRRLDRYCRSQVRTNHRAEEQLSRYGLFRQLPEPPVCQVEREVCGGGFSFSSRGGSCNCTPEFWPVCGSNGQTYGNSCQAQCTGVPILHEGQCGSGSFSSPQGCFCTQQYDPVCGTNNQTYSNACHANCAGVGVGYQGVCR